MDNVYSLFGWGSPIGTGIFLLCLAGMIYLFSLTNKNEKKNEKKK